MSVAEVEARELQLEGASTGGLWADAWRRLRHNKAALVGFAFVGLFVLTALEISASYAGVSGGILIPTLFVLAIVKFALVVLWFMHLKFDSRTYARFFVMGLAGAITLFLIVLLTFQVFSS